MSPETQTFVALVVVACTVALLIRSLLRKKKTPGCGGGCGCVGAKGDAKKIRARLGL
jgi:FeoB-associated Cys-rich membrane protein